MPAETRSHLVEAGARLFWRQGYNGTGVKQIVSEVGVPFASLYHFFPDGKEELAAAAVRWAGRQYALLVAGVLAGEDDPVAAMRTAFRTAGTHLAESGFADACPIATVALETAGTSETVRAACAETFESWIGGLESWFVAHGIDAASARPLAQAFLMLLEGAFLLARTARDVGPLHVAGEQMAALVEKAVGAG